jgi:hypothetical protein
MSQLRKQKKRENRVCGTADVVIVRHSSIGKYYANEECFNNVNPDTRNILVEVNRLSAEWVRVCTKGLLCALGYHPKTSPGC